VSPTTSTLLATLIAVIVFAAFVKLSNPHREFSTQEYWRTATIESIKEIPDEALKPGNRNGGILMWAAIASNDPDILTALVKRGADINEADVIFKGTPLTGAASFSSNPDIIDRLIELGANIHQKVHYDEDALMIAARQSNSPAIIKRLVFHGADIYRKNSNDETAFDIAKYGNNKITMDVLDELMKSSSNRNNLPEENH